MCQDLLNGALLVVDRIRQMCCSALYPASKIESKIDRSSLQVYREIACVIAFDVLFQSYATTLNSFATSSLSTSFSSTTGDATIKVPSIINILVVSVIVVARDVDGNSNSVGCRCFNYRVLTCLNVLNFFDRIMLVVVYNDVVFQF